MAQNRDLQHQNAAKEWRAAAVALTNLLGTFQALRDAKTQGGLDWDTYEAAIQAVPELAHLTANQLNAMFTSSQDMLWYMRYGTTDVDHPLTGISGNLDDAFYEARG